MRNSLRIITSAWRFNLIAAIALASVLNVPAWKKLFAFYPLEQPSNAMFAASLFAIIAGCFFIILNIFAVVRLNKVATCLVLLVNAFALYFINEYSVMIDAVMIENVLQTDISEAREIISWTFLMYAVLGALLSVAVWHVRIFYPHNIRMHMHYLVMTAVTAIIVISLVFANFQTGAAMVRNHKELRYLLMPNNYVYGTFKAIKKRWPNQDNIRVYDASKESSWKNNKKKTVFVLIIGETARADNFSLYGYSRLTNPKLVKDDIIVFKNMSSCGTSTAVSLPCMFSSAGKENFDNSVNLNPNNMFQLANRAGLRTLWIDNSSGCKGLCDGVETISTNTLKKAGVREIYDADMIPIMNDFIGKKREDAFIVMHQMGSHGPAYYLRAPQEFWQYKPVCKTERLEQCQAEEIRNAYDNTILYTDFFLSETIRDLQALSEDYNIALIYVSDHGESLGENNLYLHGLPYSIAPHEQKHVPFILWMSEGFSQDHRVDRECLKRMASEDLSHDNLFHSVLDVMDINTPLVNKDASIFSVCQRSVQ